jgi:hypothetical protein
VPERGPRELSGPANAPGARARSMHDTETLGVRESASRSSEPAAPRTSGEPQNPQKLVQVSS